MFQRFDELDEKVYAALKAALDEIGWHYDSKDDIQLIISGFRGDDLPIDVKIGTIPEIDTLRYTSVLPFDVPENKQLELLVALNASNRVIKDGYFALNPENNVIVFYLTTCYMDSTVGKGLFIHYLKMLCSTVDHFNDKLLALAQGEIGLKEYLNWL